MAKLSRATHKHAAVTPQTVAAAPTAAGHEASPGTVRTYTVGFILSIILTFLAYGAVTRHWFSGNALILVIMGLASVQLVVQLFFFLHLGSESKPRWNAAVFGFMLIILGIVVGGTLWIMYHLDYNMVPHDTETYIIKDEGFQEHQ